MCAVPSGECPDTVAAFWELLVFLSSAQERPRMVAYSELTVLLQIIGASAPWNCHGRDGYFSIGSHYFFYVFSARLFGA